MSFKQDLVKIIIKYNDPTIWNLFLEQFGPYDITDYDILYAKDIGANSMYKYFVCLKTFYDKSKVTVITKPRTRSFNKSLMLAKTSIDSIRPRARTLST